MTDACAHILGPAGKGHRKYLVQSKSGPRLVGHQKAD